MNRDIKEKHGVLYNNYCGQIKVGSLLIRLHKVISVKYLEFFCILEHPHIINKEYIR